MKQLYVTIVLSFFALCLSAQYQYQYFDGADTVFDNSVNVYIDPDSANTWQIGPPQKTIFNSASTLPNALVTDTINNYPDSNISRFTVKVLNQYMPYGVYAFQWRQKLDFDTTGDGGIIEYTIDHGATWVNAFNNPYVYNFYGYNPSNVDTLVTGEIGFTGTDTNWTDVWLCFDLSWMSQFPDTLMLRFTMKSDTVSNPHEGWMIDNMLAHITFIHTVHDMGNHNYLNVFPNPTNGIVHVETEKRMGYHIIEHMELIDSQGRVVEKWENIPTKFWFDAAKYGEGMYILKVKTNIKSETVPIIVTKQK